jgi:hypothetical protein
MQGGKARSPRRKRMATRAQFGAREERNSSAHARQRSSSAHSQRRSSRSSSSSSSSRSSSSNSTSSSSSSSSSSSTSSSRSNTRSSSSSHALLVCAALAASGPLTLALLELPALAALRDDPAMLGGLGAVLLLVVGAVAVRAAARLAPGLALADKLTAAFMLLTLWSAAIDTVLALALIGATNIGAWYHVHGEKYFQCAWGFAALMWDGTGHLALQAVAATGILQGRVVDPNNTNNYTATALLLWAGSVINSMPVLLLGAAIGPHAHELQAATALNAPYVLVPIIIAARLLVPTTTNTPATSSPAKAKTHAKAQASIGLSSAARAAEAAMAAAYAAAITLRALRAMVALASNAPIARRWASLVEPVLLEPSAFIRVQALQDCFLIVPWEMLALAESARRAAQGRITNDGWPVTAQTFAGIATLVAGAALQANAGWASAIAIHIDTQQVRIAQSQYWTNASATICAATMAGPALRAVTACQHAAQLAHNNNNGNGKCSKNKHD